MMISKINVKNALKQNTMLLALLFVMILFEILIRIENYGSLFSPGNITNLISQNAYVIVLATGMLLCILTGGNIDLAVGSIVAFVGALAGIFVVHLGMPVYLSVPLCLAAGLAIGAWQGFWIAYIRIPPFIVTLAGMLMWRGLANVILNGETISPFPGSYSRFFTGYIFNGAGTLITGCAAVLAFVFLEIFSRIKKIKKKYEVSSLPVFIVRLTLVGAVVAAISYILSNNHKGIPVILITLCVVVLAYSYFTRNTVPGRYLYAIGGNENAARMSGVNTNKMFFFAYANMGFLAGLTALICVARFNSAQPTAGTNYELDAIASCFIGGASAYGGSGTISGAVIGAIFMGVLNQGMSILGIDSNWQRAVKGFVLLLAVVFDVVSKNKKKF